jgi:hypothetical protein
LTVTWAYNAGTNTATASGAGSTNFAALVAADTAGGWGKYTADATGYNILCLGLIVIGDGTNACTFSDTKKHVVFGNANGYPITVSAASSFTLGAVIDATQKTTYAGCSITVLRGDGVNTGISCAATSSVYLYNSRFEIYRYDNGAIQNQFVFTGKIIRVWNCYVQSANFNGVTNCDYYNLTSAYGRNDGLFFDAVTGSTWDKLNIANAVSVVRGDGSGNPVFYNLFSRNSTYLASYNNTGQGAYSFVNPDVDTYAFAWSGTDTVQKAYIKYTFDLQVCDNLASEAAQDIVPISGADVTLYTKSGVQVFNATTDADGKITTQTISRCFYDQAHGDTLQDYGPHFLVVTAEGFEDYMDEIIFDGPRDYQVSMNYPGIPADLATAQPTDVLSGKTFFGKLGSQETGTLTQSSSTSGGGGYTYIDRIVEKEKIIEDPALEPSLMLNSVLLIHNRVLKRQNRKLLKEKYTF